MKSPNSSIEQIQFKEKEIISQVNQSKEQEITNYNQINSSIEKTSIKQNISKEKIKSNLLSTQIQQSRVEIEQKNIQMLIFQRSLYIMKQKFEQNRKENQIVYSKYKSSQTKSVECISTQNLFQCYKEIFSTNNINLYPYENFNDLVTADLASSINEEKYNKMINELVQYTKSRVEKYNMKYYENKMKKKKLREEEEKKKLTELEKNDVSDTVKIVHKNKRGEIITDFQKIAEANKKVVIDELIYSFTEEDITILMSKKLLYHGVIPLIIADFIQEYMEKNIKIGIIMVNKSYSHESEELLLEKNIKILYDKEIMKLYSSLNKIDPKEEKNEDLKRLLFESNSIDNKIKLYNELILENSKKGMDITYLMEMVRKLKEQKSLYQRKISEINTKKINLNYNINKESIESYSKTININNKLSKNISTLKSDNNLNSINNTSNIIDQQSKINKSISNSNNSSKIHFKLKAKKLTKTEIRNNTLNEIFTFYSKQHTLLGKTPTFGDLLTKEELMNLSEFTKFCVDFKIMVKKEKINKIFKRDLKDASLMTFEEFLKCLKKMSFLMNEEKKQYKKEKIKIYELKKQEIIEKEKRKKKKKKKNINMDINVNKNEEEKNIEQNNSDNNGMPNEEIKNNINPNNENKNIENKEKPEEKKENNEGNNNENNNVEQKEEENKENKSKSKSKSKSKNKSKKEKNKSKNILLETKEDLEEKISKLKTEIMLLEQKTENQQLEEFYTYLELDDSIKYRKKMIGYTRPFLVREDDTRNPKKNVKNPIKFNKQSIMRRYEYLLQRKDDIKKEKELNYLKEKDIKFEERKRKFNRELKKLKKDYDTKIKKDNYIQLKKNEEDYLKEKNSKLTWKYIQNNDYNTFLLNDERNVNINTIPSQLKDIFNDKNSINNDDENFINKIYSKNDFNKKKSYDKKKFIDEQENSRYEGSDSDSFF